MKNSMLLKKCATYSAIEGTMRDYQYAYLGGNAFKNRVRKKRPSEDEKLHYDVVANTAALPIARYIVDTINDTVFSQDVYRDLCFATPQGKTIDNVQITQWTELVMYDADLNNRSLNQVMEQISELSSIFGHCWVFVDMNNAEGYADRPYICAVSPLMIWDWHFVYVNGRPIPGYVKVLEQEDNFSYTFKCYYLGTTNKPSYWECWRVGKMSPSDADAELLNSGEFPPGMSIPGFISYTRRDTRFQDLGVSDIDSAADVQREVYKLECEAYQSIQFAKTLIRADAGIKIPAGAGGVIRATQGQVETMAVDTQDVERIINKQQDLLVSLENLSGMSGLRKNMTQAQSGVSIIEERKSLHKVASAKARELEQTEEKIWTYMARFMGVRWAGNIAYDADYEQSDTKLKIAKLQLAQQLAGDNPVIKSLINEAVLELLVDADEVDVYKQKMISLDPNMVVLDEPGEEQEVETTDIGDQVPKSIDEIDRKIIAGDTTSPETMLDVGIQYTGLSSYAPIADQLVARAGGR